MLPGIAAALLIASQGGLSQPLPMFSSRETPALLLRAASQAASLGQFENSATALRALLGHDLPLDTEHQARLLLMRDERALFHYRAALDAIAPLLKRRPIDSAVSNAARLLSALDDVPPEEANGLPLRLPSLTGTGRTNDTRMRFLIDSGSSFSVLPRSLALAAHLAIRPAGYQIQSADGVKMIADVATGDLAVGETVWRDAVFLVVRDGSLPSLHRTKFGLLGLPELRAADVVRLKTTHKRKTASGETALRYDNGALALTAAFGAKPVRCSLDTGSDRTTLYARFWDRFGALLSPVRHATRQRTLTGESAAPYQTALTLTLAGRTIHLPHAMLLKHRSNGDFDCTLGADAIDALAPVTLDFTRMMFGAG